MACSRGALLRELRYALDRQATCHMNLFALLRSVIEPLMCGFISDTLRLLQAEL